MDHNRSQRSFRCAEPPIAPVGAIAIQYFRLQEWVDSVTGLVALAGLIFGCGLPSWAVVHWVFKFI